MIFGSTFSEGSIGIVAVIVAVAAVLAAVLIKKKK